MEVQREREREEETYLRQGVAQKEISQRVARAMAFGKFIDPTKHAEAFGDEFEEFLQQLVGRA